MNNLEATMTILASHREARRWDDHSVALDIVTQLGLDAGGNAAHAAPVVVPGITEDEVVSHENALKEAIDKAKASRAALDAQKDEAKAEAVKVTPTRDNPLGISDEQRAREADAHRLNMPVDSTRAQIDAEEAKRRAPPTPTPLVPAQVKPVETTAQNKVGP